MLYTACLSFSVISNAFPLEIRFLPCSIGNSDYKMIVIKKL
jgi:hypothetical protein